MVGRTVVVAAALLALNLAAQERRAVVGRVLYQGRALEGAEVVLFWTPPWDPSGQDTDRVDATTDHRGQFVARLLTGRAYSAFARGPVQADGSQWISPVREGIAVGTQPDLFVGRVARSRILPVEWSGAAKLQVFPWARNRLAIDVSRTAEGFVLPALPPPLLSFLAAGPAGEPLHLWETNDDPVRAGIAQPISVQFRVVDSDGAPVADAELVQLLGAVSGSKPRIGALPTAPVRRVLGRTGADGAGTFPLWLPAAPFSMPRAHLVVRGTQQGVAVALDAWCPLDSGTMKLTVPVADQVQLRRGTAPLGDLPVVLSWMEEDGCSERVVADPQGRLFLPVKAQPRCCMLQFEAAMARAEPPRAAVVKIDVASAGERVIDVATLRRLSIQVIDRDGGPATGAEILVATTTGLYGALMVLPFRLDHAARIDLALGEGSWLLFCHRADALAHHALGEADLGGELRLTMQGMARQQCRLVDAGGNAVAGFVMLREAQPDPAQRLDAMAFALAQIVDGTMPSSATSVPKDLIEVSYLPLPGIAWRVLLGAENQRSSWTQLAGEDREQPVVLR